MKVRKKMVFIIVVLLCLGLVPIFAGGGAESGKESGKTESKMPAKVTAWATTDMEPLVKYMEALQEMVNSKRSDVEVTFEFKSDQGYEQLLMTSIAAKSGPDLFNWWAGPFTVDMATRGGLLALDDLYPKEMWDKALGVEYLVVDGKTYGVPTEFYYEILMYNKELFKKAGLDPDNFPETWDELLAACEKLKRIGVAPFAFANKEGYIADVLVEGITVQGFKDGEDVKKSLIQGTFTEPRYLKGMGYVKELYDKGYLYEGGISEPYNLYTQQMISGKAAISRGHGRFYNEVTAEIGDIMGLAVYPKWTEGGLAGKVKTGLNTAWYVTSYTEKPEMTVEVLKEFTSEEGFNMLFEMVGMKPATKDWNQNLVEDPNWRKIISKGQAEGTAPVYYPLYPSGSIYDALTKNYSLYLLGEISAVEFGKRIDAAR